MFCDNQTANTETKSCVEKITQTHGFTRELVFLAQVILLDKGSRLVLGKSRS
jgi:hypothetical protein